MKTFKISAAQGEITIRRTGNVGDTKTMCGVTPLAAEKGQIIVGHSETGHHHVMDAKHVTACVMDRAPEGMRILRLIVESPTPLVHLRGHDTHDGVMLDAGEYEARIGREYNPYEKIARRVAD